MVNALKSTKHLPVTLLDINAESPHMSYICND